MEETELAKKFNDSGMIEKDKPQNDMDLALSNTLNIGKVDAENTKKLLEEEKMEKSKDKTDSLLISDDSEESMKKKKSKKSKKKSKCKEMFNEIMYNLKDFIFIAGLLLSPFPNFSYLSLPYILFSIIYLPLLLRNTEAKRKSKFCARK